MDMLKNRFIFGLTATVALLFILFVWLKPNTNLQQPSLHAKDNTLKADTLKKPTKQQLKRIENGVTPAKPAVDINKQEKQELSHTDNYIIQCDELDEKESDKLTHLNDKVLNNKLDESIPEEYLAKILFNVTGTESEQTESEKLIEKKEHLAKLLDYHNQFPTEPLSFHRLLTECSSKLHNYCTLDFYNKINQIDKDNGALWLTLANIHLINRDVKEAEQALRKAASSRTFNSYFYETIYLHQQVMKKYLPAYSNKLVVAGIGYSASIAWGYSKAIDYCKSINSSDTCLYLGKQMKYGGKTLIQQVLGLGIQRIHHEKMGNNEIANKLKIQADNYVKQNGWNEQSFRAANLMAYDGTLVEVWLNHAIQHGETSAQKLLIEEAIWRSKDPNYNPCPNNSE